MKTETEFVLEKAAWPALILQESGIIFRVNQAARQMFGPKMEKEGSFFPFWVQSNGVSFEKFLATHDPSKAAGLKLQVNGRSDAEFLARLTKVSDKGRDYLLLQLFKAREPSDLSTVSTTGAPETGLSIGRQAEPLRKPVPLLKIPTALSEAGIAEGPGIASVPPAAPSGASTESIPLAEGPQLQKQKLDCALQLARSVALDFNNALTSILGHTSLLLSKAAPDHPWRGSLVEIEKSAAKAAETANDLAAFSRQEKESRHRLASNLNTLLERTMEAFRRTASAEVTVNQILEPRLFTANFDEAKMQQALARILENAVEAMAGRGHLQVQTRNLALPEPTQDCSAKLAAGNYVCVEISDTGRGIAADLLPRIFEPFFTTKGGDHRGLGLAWVYGIVTNHGGSVAVSSTPGVGTSVRIYLRANRKFVREVPVGATDLSGKQTILLVDDEDLILTMGQMVLTTYGYTVLTANSGQKALELFSQWKHSIGLIVTDLVMPGMSGRELTEQILRISPYSRIVWTSGYVRASDSQETAQYLQKPFTSQELLRKVKQALA